MKTFIALYLCGLSITALAQLKYSDTRYFVSFQYPKGYVLKEGARFVVQQSSDLMGSHYRMGRTSH